MYASNFDANIKYLEQNEATCQFEFNYTQINQKYYRSFFKVIYFNFPYTSGSLNENKHKQLVYNFFKVCANVQSPGD